MAWAGAAAGAVASLAANVAHAYVRPDGKPADWSPEFGSVLSAVFWPLALLVAIEVLVRVDWPGGRLWLAVRYAGLLPVATVAAVVSYKHLSGLLAHYGEEGFTATFGPLAVDGLMVICSAALVAGSRPVVADPAPAASTPVRPQVQAAPQSVGAALAVAAEADRPAMLSAAVVDSASGPVVPKVEQAAAAAREWRKGYRRWPTAAELADLTGVSQRTCGDALTRAKGNR